MSISKQFQHFHQEDLGRKVDEIIDDINYKLDQDIPIMLTDAYITAGFSKKYAHARVSNGKLNIVICLMCKHPTNAVYGILTNGDENNYIELPTDILSKFCPILADNLTTKVEYCGTVFNDDGSIAGTTQQSIVGTIKKYSDRLSWYLINGQNIPDSTTSNYFWRFEFNFVL